MVESSGTGRFVNGHGGPSLVGGMADIFQRALGAFGLAGDAELASVPYELMGKVSPFFARDYAH